MTRPNPPSSPVCFAAEASDSYMGYHDRDELVQALSELLEAERAGAKVGVGLVEAAPDPDALALARTVRDDEARWCRMLAQALRRLGAKPSLKVGDFYGKVMAIDGLEARLALLNRGQGWVVRKLEALLPKVRDDTLHAELKAMLDAHVENIELTERTLARRRGGSADPISSAR
ncbi:DUF6306 domain-containing protein [Phenylobacterium sp.]|uniref:DUF6306 domain-containing protein n=1 Tax=Phenylobacterium sp. TaxID=1871053 RepID=UPI00301C6DF5